MEPMEVRMKQLREMYLQGYDLAYICEEMGYKTQKTAINYLRIMGVYEGNKLDVNKVIALKRAGWLIDQIVDEFNHKYTAKQIIEAVNEYKREHNERSVRKS